MDFSLARMPRLEFGPDSCYRLPALIAQRSTQIGGIDLVALITGGSSFAKTEQYARIRADIGARGIDCQAFACGGEPSPDFVDEVVYKIIQDKADYRRIAVVGIGGGSAIDAGKAIAAMVPTAMRAAGEHTKIPSIVEFLEGVGTRKPDGSSAWFAAVPTTAGTGSEATKNAVISRIGTGGFKKSLRHDAFVPAVAIVDPVLTVSCPFTTSAASGLDALTQLIEAFVSPAASPIIEALCESGIRAFARSFERMLAAPDDLQARGDLAYAAYLSGVALTNAGLGSVHALASPVGARVPAPHGLVCGNLLVPAVALNLRALEAVADAGGVARAAATLALQKYARVGALLGADGTSGNGGLVARLTNLVEAAALPGLGSFGLRAEFFPEIAAAAATKTNPVPLTQDDYLGLLEQAG